MSERDPTHRPSSDGGRALLSPENGTKGPSEERARPSSAPTTKERVRLEAALHSPPPPPALALLELESIARGFVVADAVVKKAQVQLVSAGPVSPGKYLLLFAGEVAEVDESFRAGKEAAGSLLLDSMYLPQAHPQLMLAMRGRINAKSQGAVAVVETQTVAAALLSADKALKAAAVTLIQAYFARGIGGKGYYVFSGKLEDVEAALEAAVSSIEAPLLLHTELIAQPHGELNGVVF